MKRGPFVSLEDICHRCHFLSREQLEWLALAGALDGLNPNRCQTLCSLPSPHQGHNQKQGTTRRSREADGQIYADLMVPPLLPVGLEDFMENEAFLRQWAAIGFSPNGHPIRLLRTRLEAQGVLLCAALQTVCASQQVTLAGLVLRPPRPPNAAGTVFFTLKDESGPAQVTVSPKAYERIGAIVYSQTALLVTRIAEKRGDGINLLVVQALSVN